MARPVKPLPISVDRPVPKMVSANPVATWFEDSDSVQHGKDHRGRRPRCCRDHHRQIRAAGDVDRGEAGDGADQHHALDPEIEHAALFRHQLAEAGKTGWASRRPPP